MYGSNIIQIKEKNSKRKTNGVEIFHNYLFSYFKLFKQEQKPISTDWFTLKRNFPRQGPETRILALL